MSAQDYYNPGNSYPPQQQYNNQGRQYAPSPYAQQPSSASPQPQQSNTYLTPYAQQPQYARPSSAHSDYPPPAYDGSRPTSSNSFRKDEYPRPHSADPYSSADYRRSEQQYYDDDRSRDPNNPGQQDGERGLGATLLGGGAGGILGHKLGRGKLGTVLGGVVGAVAANAVEHKLQGRHGGHHGGHHGHSQFGGMGSGFLGPAAPWMGGPPQGHGHGHHGHHHGHHHHHGGW